MLASLVVVTDRLATGALVAPFGTAASIASPFGFSLILPEDDGPAPALAAAFIDWLIAACDTTARAAGLAGPAPDAACHTR